MIHLPGIFLVSEGRHDPRCVLGGFFLEITEMPVEK